MATFDPDAYLAKKPAFDPDAYLAQGAAPVSDGYEFPRAVGGAVRDLLAGGVRGAGSIGATLIRPFESAQENAERRAKMDQALTGLVGADPSSIAYGAGKIGAEIAGTAGIGGAIAKPVGAVLSRVAPSAAPAVVQALRTGGMSTGGGLPRAADIALRTGAGATVGGASAAAVNPEDAGLGAAIGAAMPGAMQVAGKAGDYLGQRAAAKVAEQAAAFSRGAPKNETVRQAVEAGYVLPPNLVRPSFANRAIESISGKQATAQLVSDKNTATTEKLVRQALGIADDAPLSVSELKNLRKTAGKAYADVSALSEKAAADLEALKVARNDAQGWFKAFNRSASPLDLAKAKEARALSDSLEGALEEHAKSAGKDELIPMLRDARKKIAKTYTVERALNDATGEVTPRVLARLYEKGAPLSDGLDVVGRTASAFPSALRTTQQTGSPAAHNLQYILSALMGGGGIMAGGGAGLAAAAIPFVTAAGARASMFRPGAQQALIQSAPQTSQAALIAELLRDQNLQRLATQAAPVISAQ